MTCPNCHQQVGPNATFCGNCGFQLRASQPAQTITSTQPTITPAVPQQVVAPQGVQPITSQPASPSTQTAQPNYAAQPTVSVQQSTFQPAYAGAGGAFVGGAVAPTSFNNRLVEDSDAHNNGKAIVAFVLGVLGCVGWLIPLVGVILGVLALVFGTIALKSQRRVFAIIGIALAVPVIAVSIFFWVRAAQHVLKSRSSPLSGLTTQSTSSGLQSITSPCYTTKIPASLTVTQTSGSCTFQALNSTSGEEYVVKVLQIPQLSISNLPQAAQTDAKNIENSIPGGSISNQQSSTFSGSPAYTIGLTATDKSAGTIDYIYDTTIQGNLVIIFHTQRSGKNADLSTIENNWAWQ